VLRAADAVRETVVRNRGTPRRARATMPGTPVPSTGSDRTSGRSVNRLLAFLLSCALLFGAVTIAQARSSRIKVITGTPANDILKGTVGPDRIDGGAGNDTLLGGGGNDIIIGGPGRDVILGGAGNDRIYARDGEVDRISCGAGRDTVYADTGQKNARGVRIRDVIDPDCRR
jgi:Ca2+-binding RTX toxin-like protein